MTSSAQFQKVLLLVFAAGIPSLAFGDATNTAAVVSAANAFMSPLATTYKTAIDSSSSTIDTSCLYNFKFSNAGIWCNVPVSAARRNGLSLENLKTLDSTLSYETNALAIATAALSTSGKKLLDDVRAADRYISGEVTNAKSSTSTMWGYRKYYTAFVGTPSTSSAWTYQSGGHHLAYNITYNGTYTSATPMFAGTEPNSWTDSTGTYAPLGNQRAAILALRGGGSYTPVYTSVDGTTQTSVTATAISTSALLSGTFNGVVMGPGQNTVDTVPKTYPTSGRGLLYSSLTDAQKVIVVDYIKSWVSYVDDSIANELLAIYLSPQALAETYVGYSGSETLATNGTYFRVDGPRLWLEHSVETGVYDTSGVHDHGVWRDKLADYGAAYSDATTIATTIRPPTITTQPATTGTTGTVLTVVAASAGTGTSTLTYQWYKDSTSISGETSSTYTPTAAGTYHVTVISTGGLTTSTSSVITVSSPTVSTTSPLPSGEVGADYSQTFTATGGTSPYTWALSSGSLPAGLSLSTAGTLSGTPTTEGTSSFSVQVTDSASATATKTFSITVTEPLTDFLTTYGLTSLTDDSDGDGISNLLEFVFGGDPTTADSSIQPTGSFDADTSIYTYAFTIPENPGGVTWTVRYSTDLSTWTDAPNSADGVTVTEGTASNGEIPVTVSIPSTTGKVFARVVVVSP
ncbi:MAG: DUF3500 domain-containing protein [Luteolibacter sp.]